MDAKHNLMQTASNNVKKAEKYLESLETRFIPEIKRLERDRQSNHSRMINFYNSPKTSHASNKKRDAQFCSKEGEKYKRIVQEDERLIKTLKHRLESAKKSVKSLKKKEQAAIEAYQQAHDEYLAARD